MIAEDLYSDKDQEKGNTKFIDLVAATPFELNNCDESGTSAIPHPDFGDNNAYDNKVEKWKSRLSKNYIKCSPINTSSKTGPTNDKKKLNIYKICHINDVCNASGSSSFSDDYSSYLIVYSRFGLITKYKWNSKIKPKGDWSSQ